MGLRSRWKRMYSFILNWHIDVSVSRLIFALLQQCKNENLFKILLSFTKKLKSNCQQIFSVLWRKVMILIQNEKGWSILNEKRLQLTKPEKLLCPYFANISQQINMSRECQKWYETCKRIYLAFWNGTHLFSLFYLWAWQYTCTDGKQWMNIMKIFINISKIKKLSRNLFQSTS